MSFAVEPVFVPYTMALVPETECDAHHRRAHDEAHRRQPRPHAAIPSSEDSSALPADAESFPPVGSLINVRA